MFGHHHNERATTVPQAEAAQKNLFQKLEGKLESVRTLLKASLRPLPTQTGDGSYVEGKDTKTKEHDKLLKQIASLSLEDCFTIKDLIDDTVHRRQIDDRKYMMEGLIKITAEQPLKSRLGQDMTNTFLKTLWEDLPHPPLSYMDDDYKYRKADGSCNNIRYPLLGAAKTPYGRTVVPKNPHLPYARPDPGLLFDCLMARPEGSFEPHPNKISSILFYLATIIIHDCFYTSHENSAISLTSSYLDLSPLYGNNQDEQDLVRTGKDGKLKPDCFSSTRILGQPPGVGVLLIMFNRFHNDIATKLPLINEGGRFTKPKTDDKKAWKKYDNDIFQTARLITCGLYINCILKDYVRTILNVNRADTAWDLDPRTEAGKTLFGTPAASGVGNQVSAEFNLLYRWHSTIAQHDEKWINGVFKELYKGDTTKMGWHELVVALEKWEKELPKDPVQRPFHGVSRDPKTGNLSDDGLVAFLQEGIEGVAGAFGANKVPKILRAVEILGIMQSRRWNLATLNEFRAYFNLKEYTTFEEINPDPEVADQLRHLYDRPENVELYPGLVVEQAKHPDPASGLCPSYTVSRAILSDAVALVRGDRFYTIDYTPQNLTNFGFEEASFNTDIDNGHVFYKLILRAFPNHFEPNSVYAHFPLVIPSENKEILTKLKIEKKYDYNKPKFTPLPINITSYDAAVKILTNKTDYNVTWGDAIRFLVDHDDLDYGSDFCLAGDGAANQASRDKVGKGLYAEGWANETRKFFEKVTIELLHQESYKLAGTNTVDIVRDVGNVVQARFAADVFCLPIKTKEHPRGIMSEKELYLLVSVAFMSIFYDADVTKSFFLRNAARECGQKLGEILEGLIVGPASHEIVGHIKETLSKQGPLPVYGMHMIRGLLATGYSVKEAVWQQLLPTCVGMVANQGQVFAQVLNFYLLPENEKHFKEISRLAKLDTKEADDTIQRYYLEGARLAASAGLWRDVQKDATVQDGDVTHHLKAGDRILVNLVSASKDPVVFPNPEQVDITRDVDKYMSYGYGPHQCLGMDVSKVAQTAMLKTVARLDNLRRVPGPQGLVPTVPFPGGFSFYIKDDGSSIWPFPTTMKVHWDGEIPKPCYS